jgi:single-strand DNA-binding protein
MTEASVSFTGNLTDDPELRHTEGGIARAMFRVAVSGRREQEASFFTVVVWRDQAEHAAQSLAKGSRVVVVGRLQQRSWTAEDGSARSVVEVMAEELGPSCGGRRQPRPGPRAARSSSQLHQLARSMQPSCRNKQYLRLVQHYVHQGIDTARDRAANRRARLRSGGGSRGQPSRRNIRLRSSEEAKR